MLTKNPISRVTGCEVRLKLLITHKQFKHQCDTPHHMKQEKKCPGHIKTISKTKHNCPRFYTFKDTMNQNNIAEKNNQQKLNKRLGYMCEIYFWFLCDIISNIMKKTAIF